MRRGPIGPCGPRRGTTAGRSVHACNAVQSLSARAASDTFVCVRQNGQWYVSLSARAQSLAPAAETAASA